MKEQDALEKYCPMVRGKCLASECMFWTNSISNQKYTTRQLTHAPTCTVKDSKEILKAGLNACPECNAPVIVTVSTPAPFEEGEGTCAYLLNGEGGMMGRSPMAGPFGR